MITSPLNNVSWSVWSNIDDKKAKATVPDEPGVYEIRTDYEFGRLRGNSRIVSIGSAKDSLRKRLCEQRFRDTARFLNRAEKWLVQGNYTLQFHFCTTADGDEAKYLEALKLMEYENEHWELPPGNEVLPKSVIKKKFELKFGSETDKALRDLLRHYSPTEVANRLDIPRFVVDNFVADLQIRIM